MPTVQTPVLDISYTQIGDPAGAPVLLLHGWPDAARGWRPVAADLGSRGWRVIMPDNRGSGDTRFRSPTSIRDGSAAALAQDAIDLADGLGLGRFSVVGHDWGGRVAYTLAALVPDRLDAIAALALGYQPRGRFVMPDFAQARAIWYQWLMYVDAGADAVRRDPAGFARIQWETWGPTGWIDDGEFSLTAAFFDNPDWADITLNAYRGRFNDDEPVDGRYDGVRRRVADVEQLVVPTLMIQGAQDYCDPPALTEGMESYFSGQYRRVVMDGVGHFPHREAPKHVAALVAHHLARYGTAGPFEVDPVQL